MRRRPVVAYARQGHGRDDDGRAKKLQQLFSVIGVLNGDRPRDRREGHDGGSLVSDLPERKSCTYYGVDLSSVLSRRGGLRVQFNGASGRRSRPRQSRGRPAGRGSIEQLADAPGSIMSEVRSMGHAHACTYGGVDQCAYARAIALPGY